MSIHTEDRFESEICADLAQAGWLYTPPTPQALSPDAARYDKAHALFPGDLQSWVQASQPQALEQLERAHGTDALKVLMDRLRTSLDAQGTLHVLHHGVEILGQRRPIALAQFRPALAMNPDLQARYAANRLRVVRQVGYSVHNANRIDLVLFLNGIPVATVELKTDYTQSVEDAECQYKTDRNPRVAGKNAAEPLLGFPGGALVHFAVSNSEVRMATVLAGLDTRFIPFNQGSNGPGVSGGTGNPSNPQGYATAYLWQEVLARDSWLDILGRYIVVERDQKRRPARLIFPRYHQLDSTRKIVRAVRDDGPGERYLIQHSAGSGKTHSIAWTANLLAELHGADGAKLFHSVVVVSDRTVLDDQLQEALESHEPTRGVVAYIQGDGGSKSHELAEALASNKKIIVCTLQTFPFAMKAVTELAATQGKRFAVIADEAHSSQTNETAASLKVILSATTSALVAGNEEEGEVSGEDVINDALAATMRAKAAGRGSGITLVGFTATPKDRTLQLFGTLPDPRRPPNGADNTPRSFHVYSMRQAIEEGFILDVLRNYTSYKVAFQLAHPGPGKNQIVDERTARAGILGWVRLHEYDIAQRAAIVVEHFRRSVEPLLNHQAKAMVVAGSRLEAVRLHQAIRKHIQDKGYDLGTLVAFSGEVADPKIGDAPVTETSPKINPLLGGRSIREAFSSKRGQRGQHAILVVANKFQTGFDEPLLCGMYIHKRLDGIAAVQTLSRLNRAHPGKDTTYVVDFVNDPAAILAAFKPYYETAELEGVTDPDAVYNLRAKLDAAGYYTDADVRGVAAAVLTNRSQSALDTILVPLANRLLQAYRQAKAIFVAQEDATGAVAQTARSKMDALRLFKKDMQTFSRLYGFLGQIFDYGNTDIEGRDLFYRLLVRLLSFDRDAETVDLSALSLTHHAIQSMGVRALALSGGEPIKPTQPGAGLVQDRNKVAIDAVLREVNKLFIGDISDHDKLVYVNDVIKGRLLDCEMLIEQAVNNTKEQFSNSPDLEKRILDATIDALSSFSAMSGQALNSSRIRLEMKEILMGPAGLYEALVKKGRARVGDAATDKVVN